ncbi:MAG TPA: PBP1A family penicillin-binding protein [Gaiellaceae bacterium]
MRLRRSPRPARKNGRRIRKLRLLALVTVLGLLSMASFTFGLITAIASEVPELDPARQQKFEHDGYIYDGAKQPHVLAVLRGSESRVLLTSDQIAPIMKQAIVAIEDKRFYEHRGVDLHAIGRAFWADVRNKAVVEGGSTITQQFIKNAYVKDRRSVARKLKEAALAWQLEQRKSKDWILTAYLNTIYFGNGAYGVGQAAITYFGKPASELTLPEAALLAGIPRDPARYDPVTNPRAAKQRRRMVLDQMLAQGAIAPDQYHEARSAALPSPGQIHLPGTQPSQGQYFVNYVKQQLVDEYGSAQVFGGGMRVYTTLDLGLQKLARRAIAKVLSDPDGPQAALVAIDPRNGDVLAMVGGSNYRESQFNLAVQGERQPGSAFKPFVLAAALDEGISPATQFVSHPVVIPLGDRLWQVNNYEGDYLGSIDLQSATIHSDNSVYAQLTQVVGPQNIARIAHNAGIRSKLNSYFAIGLGAEAANPLEMARAFSTFANGGNRIDGSILGNQPRVVIRIGNGKTKRANSPVAHRVLSPTKTAVLNSILQKVVTEGTGHRAALADRSVAGKTGTTENYGDAWFVGYTPQLAVAVWVGYPRELRPMETEYHGDPVAGGTYPAEIWKAFTEPALDYLKEEPEQFPSTSMPYASPREVVYRDGRIQIDNGNCYESREVLFFTDQEPSKTANCKPNEVDVPDLVGQPIQAARSRLAGQPLTPAIVYEPAKPGQRLDLVLNQIPKRGRLSAYDRVVLVLPRPTHGTVPKIIGLPVSVAEQKLERRGLRYEVDEAASGEPGRVVFQLPRAGVAAEPGMVVKIAVAA